MTKKLSINALLVRVDVLTQKVQGIEKRVELVEEENTCLKKENIHLKKDNDVLKEKLSKYENPKNSRNSSLPPSKDENWPLRTKSLREQTGKKPGGQPGHDGNTLKMTSTPDKIADHLPQYCSCCGSDIRDFPCEFIGERQVVDIPPVQPEYTAHRIYQTMCRCGHITKSDFPTGVNTPVSYGKNVESLIGYFHCRQYIPYDRMKEIFHDLFHLSLSEGGLHHILSRLTAKAQPVYELIRNKIANSTVVGTDETGVKINGKQHWYWTWQNRKLTFIAASENRGFKTIEENFSQGFPQSVLVHDCWKSHFKVIANTHQPCIAHLLRELNYLSERYNHLWSEKLKKVFLDAIKLKRRMQPGHYYQPFQPRGDLEKKLDKLINTAIDPKMKELASFQKRMIRYKDYLFTFLHHLDVPPDNNGSERAIRNIKVKQKISGQFRSMAGAKQFAVLRSITDTAIKNGQNVLNALFVIANLKPTD
ncbi:MAG: IS66 family transposase [Bacteroidetes bacterium]|nr:IS66 family transposase [Bacteroidota bacterium]